ncbi:MAG: hypothetical protein HY700_02265 [Gemmatimonadetes bacterium]|nr:hypothetical protein [Gemmatimonadota bacterium]
MRSTSCSTHRLQRFTQRVLVHLTGWLLLITFIAILARVGSALARLERQGGLRVRSPRHAAPRLTAA